MKLELTVFTLATSVAINNHIWTSTFWAIYLIHISFTVLVCAKIQNFGLKSDVFFIFLMFDALFL